MARKTPSKKAASKGGKKSSGSTPKFGSPAWRAKYGTGKKGRKKKS